MTFHLEQHEGIPAGLRRIAHEQVGNVLADFADGASTLGSRVHKLRSCCKKMRALLRLVQPVLGESFESEDRGFRAAARELADYRDADIIARTILALGEDVAAAPVPEPASPTEAIERALQFLKTAQDSIDRWPLHDVGPTEIAAGFMQTYRTGVESWRQVRQEPGDENFHTWRKWAKYHWYQVRLLERANELELRKRRWLLWKLQRALGEAHDVVVLEARIDAFEDPDGQLLRRANSRKIRLYQEAESMGPGVFGMPEPQLRADVNRWCSAWR